MCSIGTTAGFIGSSVKFFIVDVNRIEFLKVFFICIIVFEIYVKVSGDGPGYDQIMRLISGRWINKGDKRCSK